MNAYVLRWVDSSDPSMHDTLEEIANRYDFSGFNPDDYAGTPAEEIDIDLHDDYGNVIAWVVPK